MALGAVSCAAVLLLSGSHGLIANGVTLAEATHDGHAFVFPLLALTAVSAAIAAGLALAEQRIELPRSVRSAWACSLLVALVIGMGLSWAWIGSPAQIAHRAWSEARASPTEGGATTGRLFELSSNGRFDFWRAAWDTFREHPTGGAGGGTYWQAWATRPPQAATSEEAHSLYLGTLAELGLVGLALLLVALAPPLVAAVRSRRSPLVPLTLGAYVCWLVHSGVDWDWTLVGVAGSGCFVVSA